MRINKKKITYAIMDKLTHQYVMPIQAYTPRAAIKKFMREMGIRDKKSITKRKNKCFLRTRRGLWYVAVPMNPDEGNG